MKKFITIILALIFFITQSKGQTSISPRTDQEYCPQTDISFTVTTPGSINNITSYSGGCFVVSRNGNNFVGRFSDANLKQVFSVEYTDVDNTIKYYYPEFKKIKSLFYSNTSCGSIQPNLSIINAAGCQENTIPISFSNLQWHTEFETTASCFGSITQYEYQIPVGWKIGSTTCMNSSQWIAGSNNVNIVTDANSGDGGYVKIRPVNTSCGISLTPGYNQTVSIPIKRNPTFTISPTSFQVPCGTASTKTVAVNLSFPTGCSVSYNWSLSNPYTYTYPSGGFVPQTFTTTSPSFTFSTPAYSGVLPSISVTPVVNGVSQPTLICTASRTPIDASQYPDFAIVGPNSICSSENYTAVNIPTGFTVHWYTSTYPYGSNVAQINSPTSAQTSINAIGSGVISLIATITNQCGQQISITKSNISVGGGVSKINGYFTNYLGQYENLKTNYDGVNYIKPNYLTNVVVSNPELASATWSYITGGYNYWTQYQDPSIGTVLQINLPITNNIVLFRLTNNGSCGAQTFDFLFWAKDAPYSPYYSLSPNPASEVVNVQTSPTFDNSSSPNKVS